MFTPYDKAITAFLTSLIGLLAAFNVPVTWLNPTIIAAVTPFVTLVATWLIPNKPEVQPFQPASSAGAASSGVQTGMPGPAIPAEFLQDPAPPATPDPFRQR